MRTGLSNQSSSSSSMHHLSQSGVKPPVTNKKECVQCILGFLASKGFQPCSAKDLLRSPPLQILLDIWNFLFRFLDPNAHVTKENMVVEVPKFFKEFGYPHIMKTSHLRTPTADHQWEANLVALSWLCKLLLYEQECFGKPFDCASMHKRPLPIGWSNSNHGKATVSNTMVAHFVTEQATKHFELYLRGEENSVQLMKDFQGAISDVILDTQDRVETKMVQLEELREKTLQLQEELEAFARNKEWIKTANVELQCIEELTASLRGACLHAVETLKTHKQALRDEEQALAAQEEQNRELERLIEKQDINKNALRELNQSIRTLKARISDTNRRIKELEHEISSTETKIRMMEEQVVRSQKSLESTHESIKNFLMNNGQYAEPWRNMEVLRVNARGMHEIEILGISPTTYTGVIDRVINKDRDLMRMSNETRTELEQSNQQLEDMGNAIAKEISDTLREISSLFQMQLREEKESCLQQEATQVADAIRTAAKDELDRVKRDLEAAEEAVNEAHARLRQQDTSAQSAWKEVVERYKEMWRTARSAKASNLQSMRE
ncbi:Kinetochore protein NDC80 -like protein [Babesia sp. Xinjiang]|uniref:Kinetochore protein NDC80 -like protein n=1 Tax=Babesia sp. Xinjiang TaxID=462227 RepID=UPI000A23AB9F|nr:Kinetochore protein NDC80 -like protein [Babesia sp. Xinjiang]ORM39692.1 Kinetochore protein NDC80 -like protein [Babesia sp. Xinjiang]